MFHTADIIRKNIMTPEGEAEFQIRYIRNENAGLLTTRSKKSYLILDSIDYWYDLIQEKYPAKQKCRCKNDYFKLSFDYVPRVGTDDYRGIELTSCCTECGRQKKFAAVDIDYSPTEQLFEQPITYCERPKILYQTYCVRGYWKEGAFRDLIGFLSHKDMLIYCWHWSGDKEKKRCVKRFAAEELKAFLFTEKRNYLQIYFSMEPLDELIAAQFSNDQGVYMERDLWRKKELISINAPLMVAAEGAGLFYTMNFCGEYLEAGQVKAKGEPFRQLAEEIYAYSQKWL